RRQPQVSARVLDEEAIRPWINLGKNRCGAQPVHDLVLVAKRWRRMSRGLSDHEPRRQPTRHRLGQAGYVVPAGAGITGRSIVVVGSGAAEIQLRELRAVGVPLKHHHLRPVVPDGGSENDVLVDEDVAGGSRALSDWQPMAAELAIFTTVRVRKI